MTMSTPAISVSMSPEDEVFNFLNDRVFQPALTHPKATHAIKSGVNLTSYRIKQLTAYGMIGYFWSAMHGTAKSRRFSDNMENLGIIRFEDVVEDFRRKFDDAYIRKLPR